MMHIQLSYTFSMPNPIILCVCSVAFSEVSTHCSKRFNPVQKTGRKVGGAKNRLVPVSLVKVLMCGQWCHSPAEWQKIFASFFNAEKPPAKEEYDLKYYKSKGWYVVSNFLPLNCLYLPFAHEYLFDLLEHNEVALDFIVCTFRHIYAVYPENIWCFSL